MPVTAVAPDGAVWVVSSSDLVRHVNGRRQTISTATLPSPITALAVAPDNTIWVGTTAGAAFYNGRNWQMVTAVAGLASNHVLHIAIAPDLSIWFATTGGISHLMP
jgi:ligand-binding sensor domain-containing protein